MNNELLEVMPYLRAAFGDGVRTRVEKNEEDETVCVTVLWPGPAKDAQAAMDRFTDLCITNISPSSKLMNALSFAYELI